MIQVQLQERLIIEMEGKEMKQTPWGQADSQQKIAEGIIEYSTPSHGGIWLSQERQEQLPDGIDNFLHNLEWWEEDCDWCVPYIAFKDDIQKYGKAYKFIENLSMAYETAKHCHPGILGS